MRPAIAARRGGPETPATRLRAAGGWGIKAPCVARPPRERELARLRDFLALQKVELAAQPTEVQELTGEAGGGVERATWILVARVLLNLDEFITRE